MREYKGYTIEKITARDWMVKDADGKVIYTTEDRIPRTLKEAKAAIDAHEESKNFMGTALFELTVDISDTEMELGQIIKAVESKYAGWKFKGTSIKLNHSVVAVFEPVA